MRVKRQKPSKMPFDFFLQIKLREYELESLFSLGGKEGSPREKKEASLFFTLRERRDGISYADLTSSFHYPLRHACPAAEPFFNLFHRRRGFSFLPLSPPYMTEGVGTPEIHSPIKELKKSIHP